MSKEDGCDRYVAAVLVHDPKTNQIVVDQNRYYVTDWHDTACVVRISGRGREEVIVTRQLGN